MDVVLWESSTATQQHIIGKGFDDIVLQIGVSLETEDKTVTEVHFCPFLKKKQPAKAGCLG